MGFLTSNCGEMAVKEGFVPHFPIFLRPMIDEKRHRSSRVVCIANGPSSFREILPLYSRRGRTTEFLCNDSAHSTQRSSFSNSNISRLPELAFDRLQLSDQEICEEQMRVFGRFVARGAVLDEEYWTAAWLRAEAHWESLSYMRHVESYKRKYAEQEFYALKDRCCGRDGNLSKCFCMVAVKKEEPNVRRTVLNSVVGTLDLNIRPFYRGETYPGELKKLSTGQTSHESFDTRKYAYIANVCVSKYARRRGIASNMLHLAIDIAISAGMKQLFVHVNVDNKPAQKLYNKIGFEIVEAAPPSKDQRFLMLMEL